MLESVDFTIGEKKNVSICVQSVDQSPFEVTEATYKLMLGEEIESSGMCQIEQVNRGVVHLTALVQPLRGRTLYDLVFNYTINPEQFKHCVKVRVS